MSAVTQVRTRDEALVSVDRGLTQWATSVSGVLTQASARGAAAATDADDVVRRLAAKVAAIQQVLGSLRPEDDRSGLERDMADARHSLEEAKRASQRITAVVQRLSALQRAQVHSTETLVSSARADLSKRGGHLGVYRGGGAGAAGGGPASASTRDGEGGWLSGTGLTSVDVTAADFSDNPLIGSFGRGDTSRADYRWAVQTWDEVVGPGVAKGMTRDEFEARDAARNAPPLRRTAAVYDLFLGDTDRLRLTRRPDGSLDVTNGRHRLEVARELGIKSLPGQVIEP